MRNSSTGAYPQQLAGHKGLRRELSRTIGATSQKMHSKKKAVGFLSFKTQPNSRTIFIMNTAKLSQKEGVIGECIKQRNKKDH